VALVDRLGGEFHEVLGSRRHVRFDARLLRRLAPDLAHSDVYVCGPASFSKTVVAEAQRLGVARDRIHQEAFAF